MISKHILQITFCNEPELFFFCTLLNDLLCFMAYQSFNAKSIFIHRNS